MDSIQKTLRHASRAVCRYPNKKLEEYLRQYGELLRHNGEPPVAVKRMDTIEEVLKEADVSASI